MKNSCNARAANCHIVCLQAFLLPESAAQKPLWKTRKRNRKNVPSAVTLCALPNLSYKMRDTPLHHDLFPQSILCILSQATRHVCPDTAEWKQAMWMLVAYWGVNTGDILTQHITLLSVEFCSPAPDVIRTKRFESCFVMSALYSHICQTHGWIDKQQRQQL